MRDSDEWDARAEVRKELGDLQTRWDQDGRNLLLGVRSRLGEQLLEAPEAAARKDLRAMKEILLTSFESALSSIPAIFAKFSSLRTGLDQVEEMQAGSPVLAFLKDRIAGLESEREPISWELDVAQRRLAQARQEANQGRWGGNHDAENLAAGTVRDIIERQQELNKLLASLNSRLKEWDYLATEAATTKTKVQDATKEAENLHGRLEVLISWAVDFGYPYRDTTLSESTSLRLKYLKQSAHESVVGTAAYNSVKATRKAWKNSTVSDDVLLGSASEEKKATIASVQVVQVEGN